MSSFPVILGEATAHLEAEACLLGDKALFIQIPAVPWGAEEGNFKTG